MLKENLQNTINYGQTEGLLAPTQKQLNTIRYMVYNYKITIKDSKDMRNRQGVSRKITDISRAIKSGKVKERVNRPTNCKVKIVDGFWKLVEQRKDLNDSEFTANGFAQFVERENERQARKVIKHIEEQEQRKAQANA